MMRMMLDRLSLLLLDCVGSYATCERVSFSRGAVIDSWIGSAKSGAGEGGAIAGIGTTAATLLLCIQITCT